MSSGQKVLMGCGIAALLVVGSIVLMVGGCAGLLLSGAKDFPPYAKAEVANPANADVTDRMDEVISHAPSVDEADRQLIMQKWPAKLLYIAFKGKDSSESPRVVFQRFPWTSNSTFVLNGNGYGTLGTNLGEKKIVIIERSPRTSGGATIDYVLYIEHPPG